MTYSPFRSRKLEEQVFAAVPRTWANAAQIAASLGTTVDEERVRYRLRKLAAAKQIEVEIAPNPIRPSLTVHRYRKLQ